MVRLLIHRQSPAALVCQLARSASDGLSRRRRHAAPSAASAAQDTIVKPTPAYVSGASAPRPVNSDVNTRDTHAATTKPTARPIETERAQPAGQCARGRVRWHRARGEGHTRVVATRPDTPPIRRPRRHPRAAPPDRNRRRTRHRAVAVPIASHDVATRGHLHHGRVGHGGLQDSENRLDHRLGMFGANDERTVDSTERDTCCRDDAGSWLRQRTIREVTRNADDEEAATTPDGRYDLAECVSGGPQHPGK